MTEPQVLTISSVECCVCHNQTFIYTHHYRLNVNICDQCPLTDVMGEDVSGHCMEWVGGWTHVR